jgi:hypothetical protein
LLRDFHTGRIVGIPVAGGHVVELEAALPGFLDAADFHPDADEPLGSGAGKVHAEDSGGGFFELERGI